MAASTDISKLKGLYALLDRHKDAGEDVVADIRQEINNIELQYLKEDVFPELMRLLATRTSGLRCTIDMSLQFDGEHTFDYSFCKSGSSLFIREKFDYEGVMNVPAVQDDAQVVSDRVPAKVVEHPEISNVQKSIITPKHTSVRIANYSEHAFAVFGETRPFSEIFKEKGGYFNPRLRGGAGWIFSKRHETEIRDIIKDALGEVEPSLFPNIPISKTAKATSHPRENIVTVEKSFKSDGIKCTLEGFRTYLMSKKSNNGRPYSPSSVNVYCTATRSNYMRSKVQKYHSSGYIYNITEPIVISHLYDDIQKDFNNDVTSSSYVQAVRQYLEFIIDCINPNAEIASQSLIYQEGETHHSHRENVENSEKSRTPWLLINTIEFDAFRIIEGNSTQKFIEFINLIGPELVYQMKIPYRGGYLVDTVRNLKYIGFCKKINDGYWLNTNSCTTEKIRLMRQIGNNLGTEVKIETIEGNTEISSQSSSISLSSQSETSSRTLYSLNGTGQRNKRKTVLAVLRLYMDKNPRSTWNDVISNFPKGIQGSYGIVATLNQVEFRVRHGYDDDKRYFMEPQNILKTIDGIKFVVCHQWGNQFDRFCQYVEDKFGWTIEEVKR